jgi:hypothetical protein
MLKRKVTLIYNLTLNISDGSTIASTTIYGTDKKTYINIGSGNVFRLFWGAPTLTNDTVDYYKLVIKRHDTVLNVYYDIFDKSIGLVNEFFVDSALLPTLPFQYMLSIYIVAYGKNGSIITSNIVNPYISKGSGTYIKSTGTDKVPAIWKRALGFVKEPSENEQLSAAILDQAGNAISLYDSDGTPVPLVAIRALTSTDWSVTQEGYVKDDEGEWHPADIRYEALLVLKEGTTDTYEIATAQKENDPSTYEQIYVL